MRMVSHLKMKLPLAVVMGLLALALAASGCSQLPFLGAPTGVIEPRIVPSTSEHGSRVVERTFSFEDAKVRLKIPVNRAVYAVGNYYRAFIDEPNQEAFYASTAQALHAVRSQKKLDSARYVELVTSMVQQIEYRTDPGNLAPKFPIETLADGYGDCDDKTLLAAGILSRDGYDVAILVFTPEKHVALGIRAPGLDYKGTGYAYVEMTDPSLVGVPAEELQGGIRLTSQPTVIPIGQAQGAYTAGAQIGYIQRRLDEIKGSETGMKAQIDAGNAELNARRTALQGAKSTLPSTAGDPAALAAVTRYNEQVRAYNDMAAQVNGVVAKYNALIDAEKFVAGHQNSRPQVYELLRKVGP
jgi:hypothetical protein